MDEAFLLKRDKAAVLICLTLVTAAAWAYMIRMAIDMSGAGMDMNSPCMMTWEPNDILMVFIMWSIMMVAMMLPSVVPMALILVSVNRRRRQTKDPLIPTGLFLGAYIAVWTGFSALATLAQWGLHAAAMLSHSMAISSPLLGGAMLLASGVFQWTPFRDACMKHCRSPMGFVLTEWREGKRGALFMGLKYGTFCVGCCWMLMTLSLVLGVMNMLWMAALTVLMFWEKVVSPKSIWLSRAAGLSLIVWGLWVMTRAALSI